MIRFSLRSAGVAGEDPGAGKEPMDIEDVLSEDEPAIVGEACAAIAQVEPYRRDGAQRTHGRIEALTRQLMAAVRARDLTELRAYARQIASERYEAGFELSDVQAAFSALEAAIWHRALVRLPPYDLAWGLGLVSTALAHGRDALGRAFESAVPRTPAPTLDLTPLFKGTGPVVAASAVEEMVFPV